jgi:hypothetical protein
MVKQFTLGLGIVLSLVGIAGILTGGHDHELIIFGINTTHNIVHLASGIAAIATAMAGAKYAKLYCLAFGAVYGLVTVAGFLGVEAVVTMLNINQADNFLHLAIAGSCLYVGATAKAA